MAGERPLEHLPNGLPKTFRLITDHDSSGKAVFNTQIDETQQWQVIGKGAGKDANFALNYTTSRFPVSFKSNQDIVEYEKYLVNKPGLSIPGGSVVRVVDMGPGHTSPMHRTVSLDYGVVLEGEVYLVLDSGEEKLMRRGDISIQRGTNHAWRNASKSSWARMMYVLLEAEPLEVDGKQLGENLGDMENVRKSG
jgi:quercetin dioxygenase-like cupin family protein